MRAEKRIARINVINNWNNIACRGPGIDAKSMPCENRRFIDIFSAVERCFRNFIFSINFYYFFVFVKTCQPWTIDDVMTKCPGPSVTLVERYSCCSLCNNTKL